MTSYKLSTPHARFDGDLPLDAEYEHPPGAFLARRLERSLSDMPADVGTFDNWRDCGWIIHLVIDGTRLAVSFSPFLGSADWLLAVAPDRGMLQQLLQRRLTAAHVAATRMTALRVHKCLASTQGISVIRWWLGTPLSSASAVASPEMLIWPDIG